MAGPELLTRLRDRDPELLSSLSSLVYEHKQRLYRAACGMGFRDDEAEDMVQEVLTAFFLHTRSIRGTLPVADVAFWRPVSQGKGAAAQTGTRGSRGLDCRGFRGPLRSPRRLVGSVE